MFVNLRRRQERQSNQLRTSQPRLLPKLLRNRRSKYRSSLRVPNTSGRLDIGLGTDIGFGSEADGHFRHAITPFGSAAIGREGATATFGLADAGVNSPTAAV